MLKLGLVGCGSIAHTHVSNLKNVLRDGEVTAVYDVSTDAEKEIIDEFDLKATIYDSIHELVNSENVDAIMVCSRNDTHVEPVLEAINANKPVFVEKPLATTAEDCKKIIDAETKVGKKLVQVGFMRRFDPYYVELKDTIDSGEIGAPLMGYCRHFTCTPATQYFETPNMINDAFIHEIDIIHWLFNDQYESVQVQYGRPNGLNKLSKLKDPQVATLKLKNGALVNTYLTQNAEYGYDVMCQIMGEKGIAQLPDMPSLEIRKDGHISHSIDKDWTKRFVKAYQIELQTFIDEVSQNKTLTGPSTWDGYVAAVTADCAIQSQKDAQPVKISLDDEPDLYK